MILKQIPQHVSLAFNGINGAGRAVVNTLDLYVVEDSPASSRADAVLEAATLATEAYQDLIDATLTNEYTFVGTDFVDINSAVGITGRLGPQAGFPTTGASASAAVPPNVAVLVTKTVSSARGRRNGRWYLSAIPEGSINEAGVVDSGVVTAINAALATFLAAVTITSTTGAIDQMAASMPYYPYQTVDGERVPDTTPSGGDDLWIGEGVIIESLNTQSVVATQRRRLRG